MQHTIMRDQSTKRIAIAFPSIVELLYFVAILFSVITDFPLQGTSLGFLGSNPAFFPILMIIFIFSLSIFRKKKFNPNSLFLVAFPLIMLVYGFLIYGMFFLGENVILKGIKTLFLYLIFLFPIFFFRISRLTTLGFGIAFIISVIGIVFNNSPFVLSLHYTESLNMRNRGFALESSHLSAILMTLFPVAFISFKSNLAKITFLVGFVLSFALSDSKGGLGSLFIAIIALCAIVFIRGLARSILDRKSIVYYVITLGLLFFTAISFQAIENTLRSNVELYSSFPTRTSAAIAALSLISAHPFGVGTSGFLPSFIENLPKGISETQSIFPDFENYNEITSYLYQDTDQNISTKSFFFDGIISFGIPFVLVYIGFFYKMVTHLLTTKDYFLALFVINIAIALIIYTGSLNLYSISFFLGYLVQRKRSGKNLKI